MTHEELIQAALYWAKQGVPVFPVDERKRPLTSHGHKDGSTDEARIRRMYDAAGDRAFGIGATMGEASGLFAIDADTYKPGESGLSAQAYVADLKERGLLPDTRTHKTLNGGVHYLYYSETAWPNCKPAAGVEVKGEGGYIVVPDTPGYTVERKAITDAPAALLRELALARSNEALSTVDELKACILKADDFHASINALSAKLAAQGWDQARIQNEVLNTLGASVARMPNHPRHARWDALTTDKDGELSRMIGSGYRKFNPDAPSSALKEAMQRAGFLEGFKVPPATYEGPDTSPKVDPGEAVSELAEGEEYPFAGMGFFGHEELEVLDQKFVVHPILCEGETLLLSAAPKAGKTLVAQTLGMHIAAGQNLGDLTIQDSRPVLYFALEGLIAVKRRLVAWKSIVDPGNSLLTKEKFPFFVYERGLNLLDEVTRQDLANRIVAADQFMQKRSFAPCGAVIIDTLTKAMPGGDQNSVEDTSAVFDVITRIRELGCQVPVIFIHHDNRAGTGARGSSNIQAEPDTLLGLDNDPDTDELILKIRMARNIEDDKDYRFGRINVNLGKSEQGFDINAPVLAPSEMVSEKGGQSKNAAGLSVSKAQAIATKELDIFRVIKTFGVGKHRFREVHSRLKNKLTEQQYPPFHKRADSPDVTKFFEELIPATGRLVEGGWAVTMQTAASPSVPGKIMVSTITVSKLTSIPT